MGQETNNHPSHTNHIGGTHGINSNDIIDNFRQDNVLFEKEIEALAIQYDLNQGEASSLKKFFATLPDKHSYDILDKTSQSIQIYIQLLDIHTFTADDIMQIVGGYELIAAKKIDNLHLSADGNTYTITSYNSMSQDIVLEILLKCDTKEIVNSFFAFPKTGKREGRIRIYTLFVWCTNHNYILTGDASLNSNFDGMPFYGGYTWFRYGAKFYALTDDVLSRSFKQRRQTFIAHITPPPLCITQFIADPRNKQRYIDYFLDQRDIPFVFDPKDSGQCEYIRQFQNKYLEWKNRNVTDEEFSQWAPSGPIIDQWYKDVTQDYV